MNQTCKKPATRKSLGNCVLCSGTLIPHSSRIHTGPFPLEQWFSDVSSNQNAPKGLVTNRIVVFLPCFSFRRSQVMLMLLVWGSYLQGHCIRVTPLASPEPPVTPPQRKRCISPYAPYCPISCLSAWSIPVGSLLASRSLGVAGRACGCLSLPPPKRLTCQQAHGGMFYNLACTRNRADKDAL